MRTAALNVEGSRKVVMVMFGYVISQRAEHQKHYMGTLLEE